MTRVRLIFSVLVVTIGIIIYLLFRRGAVDLGVFGPLSDLLDTDGVAASSRNYVEDKLDTVSEKIERTVEESKIEIIKIVFGEEKPDFTVNTVSADSTDAIIIDLSLSGNLPINIKKGAEYKVKVINVPQNYCVYIEDEKYEIVSNQVIGLVFNRDGKYSIQTNLCNLNYKNQGEFVVE